MLALSKAGLVIRWAKTWRGPRDSLWANVISEHISRFVATPCRREAQLRSLEGRILN